MTFLANSNSIPDHQNFPSGWRWFGKLLIQFIKIRNRWQTLGPERKRIVQLESTIVTLREQLEMTNDKGLVHAKQIYKVGLYLLLVDRDFSVLKIDMVSTFDKWRLKFTARQMALLLYEACDGLSKMLGKNFRTSVDELGTSDVEKLELNGICKQLNLFKNTNHNFLYNEIRNLVVGHRTQDPIEFLRVIEAIDPIRVFQLGADFFVTVKELIEFITKVTMRMGRKD